MSDASANLDAANALRAKLFKVLAGQNPPPNAYLSFVSGGLPQSEFTLRFLEDPQYVDQAHNFAMLANTVPLGVSDWVASGTVMWDRYVDWLNRYQSPPYSLSKDDKDILAQAYKDIDDYYDTYLEYQGEYDNAYFAWYELYTMPRNDRPSNYNVLLAKAVNARDTADRTWKAKGYKPKVQEAFAHINDLTRRDPAFTKQNMLDKLGQPILSGFGNFYLTGMYPTNPLGPNFSFKHLSEELGEAFTWPKFTFFHNEISEYKEANSYKWGGSTSVGALLWSAAAEHEGTRQYSEEKSDISNMKIEFELLRAPITRPWFTSFLLTGHGWKWPESTLDNPAVGDQFSDGQIPPKGSWTMIPTEMIFVRNLKVKLNMSSSVNQESLTKTKSSFEGGWGPFKIKGNVETENGSKVFEFDESEDGIECTQPQIIAFYCQVMPKEPDPDWDLWKE